MNLAKQFECDANSWVNRIENENLTKEEQKQAYDFAWKVYMCDYNRISEKVVKALVKRGW